MAQFSIRQAVAFSVRAYFKHFLLFVGAGLLVGGSAWLSRTAPRFVAQQLGIQMYITLPDDVSPILSDNGTPQSETAINKVKKVTSKIAFHINNVPKHHLFFIFLVMVVFSLLHFFTLLGLIRLTLEVRDKGVASVRHMMVSARNFFRFIGASILFGLYFTCMFLGMSALTIPFALLCHAVCGSEDLTALITIFVWVVLFIGLLFWTVGYVFMGFAIVDGAKVQGARQALRMSQTLVRGSRMKVMAVLVFVAFLLTVIFSVIQIALAYVQPGMLLAGKDVYQDGVAAIAAPIICLAVAYMYRAATK